MMPYKQSWGLGDYSLYKSVRGFFARPIRYHKKQSRPGRFFFKLLQMMHCHFFGIAWHSLLPSKQKIPMQKLHRDSIIPPGRKQESLNLIYTEPTSLKAPATNYLTFIKVPWFQHTCIGETPIKKIGFPLSDCVHKSTIFEPETKNLQK